MIGAIVVGFWLLTVRENWRDERELDKKAKATTRRDSTPEGRSAKASAKSEAKRRGVAKASEAKEQIASLPPAQQLAASQELYGDLAAHLGKRALAAFKSKQPDDAASALHELASARRLWFDREEKREFMDRLILDKLAQEHGRYPVDEKILALDKSARKAFGADFVLLEGNVRPGGLRMHFPHAVPRGKDPVLFGIAADVRDDFDTAFRQEQKRQSEAHGLKKLA